MTAELADKKAAKYDAQLDLEARHWMEEIVGEPFPTGSEGDADTFHEALKDGTYLCKYNWNTISVLMYLQRLFPLIAG